MISPVANPFRLFITLSTSLWLAACTYLGTPDLTRQPDPQATATESTAGSHQWEAQPILVELYTGPGFTMFQYAWSLMPRLVIYADGRVITTSYDYTAGRDTRSVFEAHIDPAEICAVLGQIDSTGFFDFNANDYVEPQITDNGTTYITVNAWRSNTVAAYALDYALNGLGGIEGDIKVLAPLADTYEFLAQYDPPKSAPYQPERVAVLIIPNTSAEAAPPWPLTTPTLEDLVSGLKDNRAEVVLEGVEAADVYALFADEWIKTYNQNNVSYQVTIRPLLPLETWTSEESWGKKPHYETVPAIPMTCEGRSDVVPLATSLPRAP